LFPIEDESLNGQKRQKHWKKEKEGGVYTSQPTHAQRNYADRRDVREGVRTVAFDGIEKKL